MRLPYPLQLLVLVLVGWVNRQQQDVIEYLRTEVAVLRELHGPGRLRFTDAQRRRLARAAKPLGTARLRDLGALVTPHTLIRWYRELVARKYGCPRRRSPGRPPTAAVLAALVCKIANENVGFGYTRIRDTLFHLGHDLARSTVERILTAHGITPAPERERRTTWKDFLAAHWDGLAAADFFTVEVLTLRGLVRYHVFFVMRVATRRVHVAGTTWAPTAEWMANVGRGLLDPVDGFLRDATHLILDRDPSFSLGFRELLTTSGVKPVRLPRASPNLNPHAERWVRSIREECLDQLVLLGEGHLCRAVAEYVAHHNGERPHQGLNGALIQPDPRAAHRSGEIRRRDRLGGLLRFYHRAAA